jgi:AcrR family transcriptional regulator
MTSIRHNNATERSADDLYLDAARDNILAVGWRRTTLTDVAKRAGVSRMTMYRRWPDMQSLLSDLLVREWGGLIDEDLVAAEGSVLDAVVDGVVGTVAALRDNALFRRIVEVDPELLLPYLLHRRGRNQDHVLELLAAAIRNGQSDGTVRGGDPEILARALLLAVQGFVISQPTMTDVSTAELDRELAALVERYLQP